MCCSRRRESLIPFTWHEVQCQRLFVLHKDNIRSASPFRRSFCVLMPAVDGLVTRLLNSVEWNLSVVYYHTFMQHCRSSPSKLLVSASKSHQSKPNLLVYGMACACHAMPCHAMPCHATACRAVGFHALQTTMQMQMQCASTRCHELQTSMQML